MYREGFHSALAPTLREEWRSVLLLVLLYAMQGVPLGLSLGSMYVEAEYVDDRIDPQLSLLTLLALFSFPRPFLMQSRMSYTAIGIFSFAAYPYSFKLLWSPIVDSLHVRSFGLRKSWIVPIQLLSGALMVAGGSWAQAQLDAGHAVRVTAFFFVVVLLAATQDIAVDGWALTLLHPRNVGHASTCQTVGVNCGYFLSFTVFLALSDAGFCAKHFARWQADPGQGLLSLQAYLRLWGWVYILVTLALALLKRESPAPSPVAWLRSLASEKTSEKNGAFERNGRRSGAKTPDPEASTVVSSSACSSSIPPIRDAYRQLLRVTALPSVRRLALVLVVCRLGMLPAESIAPLKLLEKGVSKEALAGLVLIEFPIELVSALVAGRAAARGRPYGPWLAGYRMRLVLALLTTLAVALFPAGAAELGDAPWAFAALAALGMATSFCSTLMFTAVGSFYNRISDPSMGGAYLTLLNT
ncbi:acetyl-coenzyme A transporter 1, partial [Helicosporidium sp. ATCC 50920]